MTPTWSSGPDGVAHAVRANARFALCGARAETPRYHRGDPPCAMCKQLLEEAPRTKTTS